MGTKRHTSRRGPHRPRTPWQWPQALKNRKKKSRPVIRATCAALDRALRLKEGSLWMRIRRKAPVAGYTVEHRGDRQRSLRADAIEGLIKVTNTLLTFADLRTGFIGTPREGGGPWQRKDTTDIAQAAFGEQDRAACERVKRALVLMRGFGWLTETKQVRIYDKETDTFTSEPAVRHINFRRLCKMVGTLKSFTRDLGHALKSAVRFAYRPARKRGGGRMTEARREMGMQRVGELLASLGG